MQLLCVVLISAFVSGSEAQACTTAGTFDCSYAEGCVGSTCQDACTTDSECDQGSGSSTGYGCDPAGNGGAGRCTLGHCSTTQQCKDWYSDTWKCVDNDCTILSGCECGDKCKDDYYGKILAGSIAGAVIALIFITAVAIPCCCGKDFDKPMCPKIVGGIAVAVGILCIFIPLMASGGAADGATDDVCKECDSGCSAEEKQSIRDLLGALGVFVAYTSGMGWLACILGITASAMGCCAICPCCGPLKDKAAARQQPPPAGAVVVGQAVGQPTDSNAK